MENKYTDEKICLGDGHTEMISYRINDEIFYKMQGTIVDLDNIDVEIYLITSETIQNDIMMMTILGKYAEYIKNDNLFDQILSKHTKYLDTNNNNLLNDDALCKIINKEIGYYIDNCGFHSSIKN